MKYTGILLALAGPCALAFATEPAAAFEPETDAAIRARAPTGDRDAYPSTESVAHPDRAAQYLSTCDPEDELTQTCCDAVEQAVQVESAARLAAAMEVCDPGTDATASGDCATGTCNGQISCKKLKKLCNNVLVQGEWTCTETSGHTCTGGTCKKCFD